MTDDVIVIGAGQAGLSASAHLIRKGLRPGRDFLVLDGNDGPGGAWRDRWDSLTFDAAHGIAELPDFPLERPDPTEPASRVVARYYGAFERERELGVVRPVAVHGVERTDDGLFEAIASDGRRWRSRAIISATGTWNSPYLPHYPGQRAFAGRQLHTRGYRSAAEFAGERVLVVGGGASAAQFVLDLGRNDVETVWTTRRPPLWTDRFDHPDWGIDVERSVGARTRAGLPPISVVGETGLSLNELYRPWIESGRLISRGPLLRLTERAAVLEGPGPDGGGVPSQGEADALLDATVRARIPTLPGKPAADSAAAWEVPIDAVLWATGFRAHIAHLSPLHVREPGGGIRMGEDGVSVERVPGLFLVGYGASASTIGATRAGRRAAVGAAAFAAREPDAIA